MTMDYAYYDTPREDILRMVPSDGQVIGSIGCGYGATEAVLVSQGREVHGVDIVAEAIERAAKRLTSARVIAADDVAPFDAGSLDGLILADVIEHIPRAWEALGSFVRAVKPGGWVVVSVPNMRSLKVLKWLMVRGDWPEEPTGIFDATHVQVMTRKRLVRWCGGAGLKIERWYDAYLSNRWKRSLLRVVDYGTFRLFKDWWMVQLQCVARRTGS